MLSSLEKNESRPLFQCGICNQIFDPVSFRLTSIWITSPNRLNYFNILTISCIPLPSLCVFIDLSRSFPMHANGIYSHMLELHACGTDFLHLKLLCVKVV